MSRRTGQRQLIATVEHRDGRVAYVGIVLDPRPMTPAESTAWSRSGGCRCADSASAVAAGLSFQPGVVRVTISELVHVPAYSRLAGPGRAAPYRAVTYCTVIARAWRGDEVAA